MYTARSTSGRGATTRLACTICSIRSRRSWASPSRWASFSRSSRTAWRRASSDSKSPTSRANASSSTCRSWTTRLHRLAQGVERLEVPDLARKRVVQLRQVLAFDLLQRQADGARLAALRLLGKVGRETHRGVERLAGEHAHEALFDLGDRPPVAQHDVKGFRIRDLVSLACRDRPLHQVLERRFLAHHRHPRGLLLAQRRELRQHPLLGDLGYGALEVELPDALECQLGLHLDVELERHRAPRRGVPLEVVHVWVGDRLQRPPFLCECRLPALTDQVLERLLPDVVGELLLHECGRCLALAESREPGALLVGGRGACLGFAHLLDRHGHGERSGAGLFGGLSDLNGGHVGGNLIRETKVRGAPRTAHCLYWLRRKLLIRRCGRSPGVMSSSRTTLIAPSGSSTANSTSSARATPCSRSACSTSSRVTPARWQCSSRILPW